MEEIEKLFDEALDKYNKNDFKSAISGFENVLKIENNNIKALEAIGVCYSKLDDIKNAIYYFDKALNMATGEEDIISLTMNKIAALFKKNDYKDIIDLSIKILEKIDSTNTKVMSNLYNYIGISYYFLNNDDEAINAYDKSIKLNPYNVDAYKNKGLALKKLGEEEKAQRYFNMSAIFEKEEEYKLYIQSLSGKSFSLNLNTKYQCVVLDLMDIFSDIDHKNQKVNFTATYQMTKDITSRVRTFLEKYSTNANTNKLLKDFIDRFRSIPIGDWFCVLPGIEKVSTEQFFEIMIHLKKESGIDNTDEVRNEIKKMLSSSISLYDIEIKKNKYNQKYKKRGKGKSVNTETRCKYCPNKKEDVFKGQSHIIPESLGGNIIDEEECDCCNARFGESIEEDLGNYLKPWKTIYRIKGYHGIPKFEPKDGFIKIDDDGKLLIGAKNIEVDDTGRPKKITLNVGNVNMQNVYRAFVKIAIGFIPGDKVRDFFSKTIKWINGDLKNEKLPPIITYFNKNILIDEDKPVFMSLFYRKETTPKTFPYLVAEFIFYNFSFIYIVPFSSNDNEDFSNKEKFDDFHKNWHSYKVKYGLIDCNKDEEVNFRFIMNLTQSDDIEINDEEIL